jgi:ubiquinone/menaquinone biosynthesis C-methylase UbiE
MSAVGTGNFVARLRHKAISVTGIEASPSMARIAAERFADDPRGHHPRNHLRRS